jgi:hypothetical protein
MFVLYNVKLTNAETFPACDRWQSKWPHKNLRKKHDFPVARIDPEPVFCFHVAANKKHPSDFIVLTADTFQIPTDVTLNTTILVVILNNIIVEGRGTWRFLFSFWDENDTMNSSRHLTTKYCSSSVILDDACSSLNIYYDCPI